MKLKTKTVKKQVRPKRKKGMINSNTVIVDGIEMKSNLEGDIYKFLKNLGITPIYEPETFTLWYGSPTKTPFYNAKKGHLRCFKADLEDITYTPDFYFEYGLNKVYVEGKGYEDSKFPIRKKLFRHYLDENIPDAMYFEIRSLLQCKDMMEILQYGKIISKKKPKPKSNKK